MLANLTNLIHLGLSQQHNFRHICIGLALTNLTHLNLDNNCLSDLSPLVANTGFGNGTEVDVRKNPLSAESLNTHIPVLQSRGVDVQFDNQPVLECVPILPQNLSVDAGSSHTLQSNYLYVDHQGINPRGLNWGLIAVAYADFNEDGHIDVFYAPLDGTPHATPAELYLNDGTGCFSLDTSFFNGNPPGSGTSAKGSPRRFQRRWPNGRFRVGTWL